MGAHENDSGNRPVNFEKVLGKCGEHSISRRGCPIAGGRGRKNDFRDAERLVKQLVSQELSLSLVPNAEQRLWRTLTRTKYQRTGDRGRLQNQREALLEEAPIKLSSLVSDLLGARARRMLKALGNRRRLGHITKQGSSIFRFLLVEAAQASARSIPQWRSQYLHLMLRRGRKTAKVAMARKLAVHLYWMMRQGWDYQQWVKSGSQGRKPRLSRYKLNRPVWLSCTFAGRRRCVTRQADLERRPFRLASHCHPGFITMAGTTVEGG